MITVDFHKNQLANVMLAAIENESLQSRFYDTAAKKVLTKIFPSIIHVGYTAFGSEFWIVFADENEATLFAMKYLV